MVMMMMMRRRREVWGVSCEGREYYMSNIYERFEKESVKAGEGMHVWAERLSKLEP